MEYAELLTENRRLKQEFARSDGSIAVLSNITIDPLREFLEYGLATSGVAVEVEIGTFDNIVQDSSRCGAHRVVIVFWELATILDGLLDKGKVLDDAAEQELVDQMKAQIALVLANLASTSLVLFNRFSALPFPREWVRAGRLDRV